MKLRLLIIAIICLAIGAGIGYKLIPHSIQSTPSNMIDGSKTIPLSIVSLHQDVSSSPSVDIEYPQFPSLPKDFNDSISSAVNEKLAQFKKDAAENDAARKATADPAAKASPSDYSFIASWQEAQINDRYVSFIIRFDSYTGGANGIQEMQTFNYDIGRGMPIGLSDLFPNDPEYLKRVSDVSREQLTGSMTAVAGGQIQTDMLDQGTEPIAENFKDFTFTGYAVNIYFPKYAVAPGAFGEQHVTISRSEKAY